MKTPAFLLVAAYAGALLLSGCNTDNSAGSTATDTAADTHAHDAASGDTAGTGHAHDAGHGPAGGPMLGAMNTMMQKMHATKPTGNTDRDFALMMRDHHEGAVEMVNVLLRDGQDAALKELGRKMAADQKKEIQELGQIAQRLEKAPANYQPTNAQDPFQSKMQASMAVMMQNMPQESGNTDQEFAAMMIPHHQSAIDMARAELAHGQDARLKAMAQQMITEQEREIKQLQDWLSQHKSAQ